METLAEDPSKTVIVTALVTRADGRLLVVWNKRQGCWTLPGGHVEEGESPPQALFREIREETGCTTPLDDGSGLRAVARHFYTAPGVYDRAWTIHVFHVENLHPVDWRGVPRARETESGCPVTWWTREEFLRWCSPKDDADGEWPAWYREMFASLDGAS